MVFRLHFRDVPRKKSMTSDSLTVRTNRWLTSQVFLFLTRQLSW